MKAEKTIGILLIAGAIGVFVPYTILSIIFEYPLILRQQPGTILTKFHQGGGRLTLTWWAFATLGLPLLVAYIKIGQWLQNKTSFMQWITVIGIISGIAQIIGLLRWVFVVPVIANNYVNASSDVAREIAISNFQLVHQFGGVLLGEHIGQLFTIIYTIVLCYAFLQLKLFPQWISWFGFVAAAIYLLAQADLFAIVIPGFPVVAMAGFIGSTLWLLWLLLTGVLLLRRKS
ncbi:MAG: DUF4386 domain-containing protein [Chitinophagaceae bacterium]